MRRRIVGKTKEVRIIDNPKYNTDTCAVDIHIPNSGYRCDLIKISVNEGWTIGIASTYVHLD